MTLQELNHKIKKIDCGMLTTHTDKNEFNSRPMLTITDDENPYNLYFFCMKNSQKIVEIKSDNRVAISYQDKETGVNLHILGKATLIDQPKEMQKHWDKKLNVWWQKEENTDGICMIIVKIEKFRYWTIGDNGEVALNEE